MKIIIKKTYEKLSEAAAQIMFGTMYQDRRINLSLTGGSSPAGTYDIVTEALRDCPQDFKNVHFYNFDNVEMEGKEGGVMLSGLYDQFFRPAAIPEERIHPLRMDNWQTFDGVIENSGGLDLMLIGLGMDGHFCGNLSYATEFEKTTYLLKMDPQYEWYETYQKIYGDKVMPEYLVTLGAVSLMRVKHLLLVVNGKEKASVVKQLMESKVGTNFPSSVLKLHPNFTVILDEDAASML